MDRLYHLCLVILNHNPDIYVDGHDKVASLNCHQNVYYKSYNSVVSSEICMMVNDNGNNHNCMMNHLLSQSNDHHSGNHDEDDV